jgi:hypothetical protein
MTRYVTHQFAHLDTLGRAEKWLHQLGFDAGQIEVHREGVPWISVMVTPEQTAKAVMVFEAAEHTDPEGWPSFWELAKMPHPHPHAASSAEAGSHSELASPRNVKTFPVSWHPPDSARVAETDPGMTAIWDVFERYL